MYNTETFILEVQKRPCLWNTKDSSNGHRQLKLQAWEQIAKLLNKNTPSMKHVTIEDLQRKWKHLRDYYTREKKRTNPDPDTITTDKSNSYLRKKRNSPLLDMLQFLDVKQNNDIALVTIERSNDEENFYPESNEEDDRSNQDEEVESPRACKVPKLELELPTNPLRDDEDSTDKELLSGLLPVVKNMTAKEKFNLRGQQLMNPNRDVSQNSSRDEFSIYGQYIASKMRNIQNKRARHTAEFYINRILYKAEMGEFDGIMNATQKSREDNVDNTRVINSLSYNIEDESEDGVETVIKCELID